MKFRYYLESIAGIEIYPLISLLLFVSFFIIVTLWVYKTDKKTIEHIENLPLNDNNEV